MISVEKSAKTVEEALKLAYAQLNITSLEAEYEIIDHGSKGFLGFGAKEAKVKVTKIFDPEKKAKDFIREICASIGVSVNIETILNDKKLDINLTGTESGIFIGKRGQTLESLQYLINLVINKGDSQFIAVVLDIENYRQRRKDTLESLAYNLAKKVKQTNKPISLEPMISYERRIIHSALQNDRFVTTKSEGSEPYRNVVIVSKRSLSTSKSNATYKKDFSSDKKDFSSEKKDFSSDKKDFSLDKKEINTEKKN